MNLVRPAASKGSLTSKPAEEPLTEFGKEILRRNSGPGAFNPTLNCLPDGTPHADLLPEPFKIIPTPGEIVMLYEVETTFRQIFTDGRKQLTDPSPSWMGYSVGKWDGDTLVVDTVGCNDKSWLDARGHSHSEEMRVQEHFRRRDYGHLEVTLTITGPKVSPSRSRSISSRAFFRIPICSSTTAWKANRTRGTNRRGRSGRGAGRGHWKANRAPRANPTDEGARS